MPLSPSLWNALGATPRVAVFDWASDSGDPVPVPLAVHCRVGPGNARTETPCRNLPR